MYSIKDCFKLKWKIWSNQGCNILKTLKFLVININPNGIKANIK